MPNSNIKYQVSGIGKLRVAIVHDWLYGGGAEQVVLELHKIYPDAPIYTSYCSDEWRKKLDNKVITGYLQNWPFSKLRKFLPVLRQFWFKHLDLSGFDLIISSSGNGEAKFVRMKPNSNIKYQISNMQRPVHICYCHTPVHFYWRHYHEYLKNPGFKPEWLARFGLKLLVKPLRKRDYKAAQKVDYFIANSSHIQSDIKKFYGKDSVVIHPPVNTKRFASSNIKYQISNPRSGFVTMGRQVPYKKTDILVQACKELKVPLSVIGRGPEHSKLVAKTGPTIHFKADITDEQMPVELANAKAFLFAAFEDFGVAPVEAMAAGTPVIAFKAGGALDYVIPGKTGEFFEDQTIESLKQVIEKFDSRKYNPEIIKKEAEKFNSKNFQNKFKDFISNIRS